MSIVIFIWSQNWYLAYYTIFIFPATNMEDLHCKYHNTGCLRETVIYNLFMRDLKKCVNPMIWRAYIGRFFTHSPHISGYFKTLTDTIRPQQTPFNININRHTTFKCPFLVSGDVCWCRFPSVGDLCCPQLSWDTRKRRLRAYEWSVSMFVRFGAANVFNGKNSERLNYVQLRLFYQNTKTSL